MCYIAIIIAHQIGFVKHFSAGAFLEGPVPRGEAATPVELDYVVKAFGRRVYPQVSEPLGPRAPLDDRHEFMAQTAAMLNPDKTVIIPDPDARCPMAAQLPPELVREAKRKHPGAAVVLYIK
jgi:hypothetical protein